MRILLILAAGAVGLWVDVLFYRWVKSRWPTVARVLLVCWVLSSVVTIYRLWRSRTA
jgi:uncharacterized membrane protein YqjE